MTITAKFFKIVSSTEKGAARAEAEALAAVTLADLLSGGAPDFQI